MVKQEGGDDFPSEVDLELGLFLKYKKPWLYWRALGRYDSNGSFVKPVTWSESKQMPKEELDTYLELDRLFAIRRAQALKKKETPHAKPLRRKK